MAKSTLPKSASAHHQLLMELTPSAVSKIVPHYTYRVDLSELQAPRASRTFKIGQGQVAVVDLTEDVVLMSAA